MLSKIFRAVYYERVSTSNEEQASSMENQRKLCERYLENHPEIILAEPIDSYSEIISGKSDCRPKYIEMMSRLAKGDIDYLIVKDLKRLSRSTEVSAQLRNYCKKYGFRLILLETGQIYDPNDEGNRMLYGFEALVNEEVVFRQSTYGKIAHRQKMEAKRLNRQNVTFGYKWDSEINDIVIEERDANIVRSVFDMVVFNDMGIREIRNALLKKGVCVCDNTITNWLNETAYIGLFNMNKKGSELGVGAGQKTKRYTNPKDQWVTVERRDLQIVSKEIFELSQKIRETRKNLYKRGNNVPTQSRFQGTHLFSAKIFCAECGNSYQHYWTDRNKTVSAYKDSFYKKRSKADEECPNKFYGRIYERDLEQVVIAAINGVIQEQKAIFPVLLGVIREELKKGQSNSTAKQKIIKDIEKLEKKAQKVMQNYLEASGAIKQALANEYEQITAQVMELKSHNMEEENNSTDLEERIHNIMKRIEKLQEIQTLDRDMVMKFVHRIEINKEGKITVVLTTERIFETQANQRMKKKQEPIGPASFAKKNKISYQINKRWYQRVVKMLIQGMTGH